MYRSIALLTALLMSGCTINKTPEPVKGSKVAGVVRLGFDKSPLQNARVDTFIALSAASHQCQQWGYISALPYGEPITTCSVTGGSLCLSQQVTLEYQCQGIGMEKYVRDNLIVQ